EFDLAGLRDNGTYCDPVQSDRQRFCSFAPRTSEFHTDEHHRATRRYSQCWMVPSASTRIGQPVWTSLYCPARKLVGKLLMSSGSAALLITMKGSVPRCHPN